MFDKEKSTQQHIITDDDLDSQKDNQISERE